MSIDLDDPVAALLAAHRAFERAGLQAVACGGPGTLPGEAVRVTTPEDYVLLKVLATRDRDLEDAASVVEKQRGRLDWPLLEREVAPLASEIPDHDVARRYTAVAAAPGSPSHEGRKPGLGRRSEANRARGTERRPKGWPRPAGAATG